MTTGAAVPLQYDVSRRRALTSWLDFPALARLVVEAALVAIPIAAVVFFSLINFNALVTFFIGLAQGVFVGLPLRWVFRRTRVRQKSIALVVALGAGAFSALLVYAALYVRQAYAFQTLFGAPSQSHLQNLLALLGIGGNHPYRRLSALSNGIVGHGGFLGYLLLRFHQSPSFLKFFTCHTLLTAFLTWRTSRKQITAPFCAACEQWLGEPKNVAVAPTWLLGELMASIVDSDSARAIDVARKSADADLGGGCAIARVRACPTCRCNFVEVILKTSVHTGRSVAKRVASKLPPTHVTDELLQALRSEPAVAIALEEPESLPLIPSPGTPGEG